MLVVKVHQTVVMNNVTSVQVSHRTTTTTSSSNSSSSCHRAVVNGNVAVMVRLSMSRGSV